MLNPSSASPDPLPEAMPDDHLATLPAPLQLAFLHHLCVNDLTYPWLVETAESLDYFAALDAAAAELHPDFATLLEEEPLDSAWHSLSQQLEATWSEHPALPAWQSLHRCLCEQFESRIPADLLATLAQTAQQVAQSSQSVLEQLVSCAQALVPEWDGDDLQVIARPMAYAFRGISTEAAMEAALRSVRFAAWTELSGVEQARLSVAIARYALAQAETDPTLATAHV